VAKVLPVAEPQIIRRLLTQQAEEFFAGAQFMDAHKFAAGDSCYFLKLMAIELYFKLIYLSDTESLVFGHDVREIYDLLPTTSRTALFDGFNAFMSPRFDHSTFRVWLKYIAGLFVQIRYPFEEFREMTVAEYEQRMREFEEAPVDDLSKASIIYHHDRVNALLRAQRSYLELNGA
jgi:hypothetical protein